jgi:hypothetical protein
LVATIFLLYKGRIYLDSESKQPIEYDVPLFGKIKSQNPVLMMMVLGAVMVSGPALRGQPATEMVDVAAEIQTDGKPILTQFVEVPVYQNMKQTSGKFSMSLPRLASGVNYRAQFLVDKYLIAEQDLTVKDGQAQLSPVVWIQPKSDSQIQPKNEVSDADKKLFGINEN